MFRVYVPSLCVHKARRLAYVRGPKPERRLFYLGRPDDPDTLTRYRRFCAAFIAADGWPRGFFRDDESAKPTIGDLVRAYGQEKASHHTYATIAIRVLKELYQDVAVEAFTGRLLRDGILFLGKSGEFRRPTVNKTLTAAKRIFRHGNMLGIVPPDVLAQVLSVEGLRRGDVPECPEAVRREPVTEKIVRATCKHLPPTLQAAVWVLWYTAARPSEVLGLRVKDIVRDGKVWRAELLAHKTAAATGKPRVLYFGQRAQKALRPLLLKAGDSEAFIFSPKRAVKERAAQCRGHRRADQKPNKRKTRRTLNERYDAAAFGRAIRRACEAAGVEVWTPYRLRHSAACRIRAQYGLDGAQVALGHANANITQVYAQVDEKKAREIAAALG